MASESVGGSQWLVVFLLSHILARPEPCLGAGWPGLGTHTQHTGGGVWLPWCKLERHILWLFSLLRECYLVCVYFQVDFFDSQECGLMLMESRWFL